MYKLKFKEKILKLFGMDNRPTYVLVQKCLVQLLISYWLYSLPIYKPIPNIRYMI